MSTIEAISTFRALKLALEALELSSVTVDSFGVQEKTQEAITALREALAEQTDDGWAWPGMTLRDYFAAKASEDDIGAHSLKGFKEEYVLDLNNGDKELRTREARWSREQAKFRYADAMLKAREA